MGPLEGLRIIEMAGLGPGPFCGMLLADMGAEVIRIDRPNAENFEGGTRADTMGRGKRSITLDMKKPDDREVFWKLLETVDGLIEGMRPGVMERLGIGPDEALKRKPKLVYGRMTGFGQTGPLARAAGHDINYAAISGTLGHIGLADKPIIPLNLVADFGGGGMFLAVGMVSALLRVARGGDGQVVDATMVDGAASLATVLYGLRTAGRWTDHRQDNFLDGGAHFYNTYKTKDDLWVSVGAIEPQFYADLLKGLGLEKDAEYQDYWNRAKWPGFTRAFAAIFRTRTRAEWDATFASLDACYAPILTFADAPQHPANVARGVFVEIDGVTQPGPAPRFSVTRSEIKHGPPDVGQHTDEILAELGFERSDPRDS